jgi:hypothetical protein
MEKRTNRRDVLGMGHVPPDALGAKLPAALCCRDRIASWLRILTECPEASGTRYKGTHTRRRGAR